MFTSVVICLSYKSTHVGCCQLLEASAETANHSDFSTFYDIRIGEASGLKTTFKILLFLFKQNWTFISCSLRKSFVKLNRGTTDLYQILKYATLRRFSLSHKQGCSEARTGENNAIHTFHSNLT